VILGEDEVANNVAAVKSLRGAAGEQQQATVAFDAVVDHIVDAIVGDHDHDHEHVHYHP
jgi:histidyl-tRNA synthetase